jgi:hypothetical protein
MRRLCPSAASLFCARPTEARRIHRGEPARCGAGPAARLRRRQLANMQHARCLAALLLVASACTSVMATLPRDLSNFQGKWPCSTSVRMGRPKVRAYALCIWLSMLLHPENTLARSLARAAQTIADVQAIVASATRVRVRLCCLPAKCIADVGSCGHIS